MTISFMKKISDLYEEIDESKVNEISEKIYQVLKENKEIDDSSDCKKDLYK